MARRSASGGRPTSSGGSETPDPGSRDPGSGVEDKAIVARALARLRSDGQTSERAESPLIPGEQLEVSLGAETYAPVKFHAFTVGPFSARVTVRKGETAGQARDRALAFLREAAEVAFEEGLKRHLERLERAVMESDASMAKARDR